MNLKFVCVLKVVVLVLLLSAHGKQRWSCLDGQLT